MYIKNNDNQMPGLWAFSEKMLSSHKSVTYLATVDRDRHEITKLTEDKAPESFKGISKLGRIALMATGIAPLFLLIARSIYRHRYGVNEAVDKVALVGQNALQTGTTPGEPVDEEGFTSKEKFAILSSAFEEYQKVIHLPEQKAGAWKKPAAQNFLHQELQRILIDIEMLIPRCTNDTLLKNGCAELRKNVIEEQKKLKIVERAPRLHPPIGLSNQGNTCYMNAALQPLLALGHFTDYFPKDLVRFKGESRSQFALRKDIYDAFKRIVQGHRDNKDPKELGKNVGELRRKIFEADFDTGNFQDSGDEGSTQDSGNFFQLLLKITGQEMATKVMDTALDGNQQPLGYSRQEIEPQTVLILKSTGFVQQRIEAESKPVILEEDGWKVNVKDLGNNIPVSFKKTEVKLLGDPPPLLILQVGTQSYNPVTQTAHREGLKINPEIDGIVHAQSLFEKKLAAKDATYELVGFCQNIDEFHWTSVVKTDKGDWRSCDDSSVRNVETTDKAFKRPANYVIYRKMKIS